MGRNLNKLTQLQLILTASSLTSSLLTTQLPLVGYLLILLVLYLLTLLVGYLVILLVGYLLTLLVLLVTPLVVQVIPMGRLLKLQTPLVTRLQATPMEVVTRLPRMGTPRLEGTKALLDNHTVASRRRFIFLKRLSYLYLQFTVV